MRGPINPLGSTLPDGRWWPSIGGPAMCCGERVRVVDLPPAGAYGRDAWVAWPRGLDELVPVGTLTPVPEFGTDVGEDG